MEPFYAYIVPVPAPGVNPPGYPAHPIYNPVFPAHPIAPGGPPPTATPPIYYPPGIWPSPGHPAHPIVLPPPPSAAPPIATPPAPAPPGYDWVQSYVPGEGHWEWTLVPEDSGNKPAHPIAPGGPNIPPALPKK